ncbi:heat shock protein 30 [Cristinia sonorae]|uniref:Heat shock protein 30 n=1 Tax=Cristinia sonorae TaxID=1940300 RepID=A0A8K0UXR1_9AGAR|nr:heat shock protein 30 [Cristinia sonorae]
MSSTFGGSLDTNPPNADRHITNHGSDWLWAVFAVMALSTLGMIAWSYTRPRGTRFFHNLAIIILATSTISYYSMASDLGSTPVRHAITGTRQTWFVRYIQWFITFPLLLIMLLFSTGLSLSDILTTAFFAWVAVVCGLLGALTSTGYKWGYFVFGVLALCYIWGSLLGHGPRTTFNAGAGVRSGYVRGAGFVAFITMMYPIAWALNEGSNKISPNGEMIWYGILDLLLGPLFLYYFIFGLRKVDYGAWGFHSGKYSDGPYGNTGGHGVGGHGGGNYGNNVAGDADYGTRGVGHTPVTKGPAVV